MAGGSVEAAITERTRTSVALVEDDAECANACSAELTAHGYDCSWFSSARAAIEAAQRNTLADVVLMDLRLPGESAFEAIETIRAQWPRTAIVALTGHAADELVFRALRAGAVGYVLKNDAVGNLAAVISDVVSGGAPLSPAIARRVVGTFCEIAASPSEPARATLTGRECEMLELFAKGLSYSEAARALGIAVDTVRAHVRNVYEKLHASSKAEAVAYAIRDGLLE